MQCTCLGFLTTLQKSALAVRKQASGNIASRQVVGCSQGAHSAAWVTFSSPRPRAAGWGAAGQEGSASSRLGQLSKAGKKVNTCHNLTPRNFTRGSCVGQTVLLPDENSEMTVKWGPTVARPGDPEGQWSGLSVFLQPVS